MGLGLTRSEVPQTPIMPSQFAFCIWIHAKDLHIYIYTYNIYTQIKTKTHMYIYIRMSLNVHSRHCVVLLQI